LPSHLFKRLLLCLLALLQVPGTQFGNTSTPVDHQVQCIPLANAIHDYAHRLLDLGKGTTRRGPGLGATAVTRMA